MTDQFVCVPLEILARNLSPGPSKALIGLLSFRNRRTGRCNPSLATLAGRLNVPAETVRRWLRGLRRAGIITTELHPRRSTVYGFRVVKGEHPGCATVNTQGVQICPVDAPVSLYEPDEVEPDVNGAAAVDDCGFSAEEQPPAPAATATLPVVRQTENPTPNAGPAIQQDLNLKPIDPVTVQAEMLVEELHAVHPQPGLPDQAVARLQLILAAAPDPDATAALIRIHHEQWRAHWATRRPGQFIPNLSRWFRSGEWKWPVGKPVRHENFYEKAEREWEESRPSAEQQREIETEIAESEQEEQRERQERAAAERKQRRQWEEAAREPWPEAAWITEWEAKHAKKKSA